jgi:hypothetical protein
MLVQVLVAVTEVTSVYAHQEVDMVVLLVDLVRHGVDIVDVPTTYVVV